MTLTRKRSRTLNPGTIIRLKPVFEKEYDAAKNYGVKAGDIGVVLGRHIDQYMVRIFVDTDPDPWGLDRHHFTVVRDKPCQKQPERS